MVLRAGFPCFSAPGLETLMGRSAQQGIIWRLQQTHLPGAENNGVDQMISSPAITGESGL